MSEIDVLKLMLKNEHRSEIVGGCRQTGWSCPQRLACSGPLRRGNASPTASAPLFFFARIGRMIPEKTKKNVLHFN